MMGVEDWRLGWLGDRGEAGRGGGMTREFGGMRGFWRVLGGEARG